MSEVPPFTAPREVRSDRRGGLDRRTLLQVTGAASLLAPSVSQAQPRTYPDRTVRIVVPYPPGGFNDTHARIVGEKLHDAWGQPVITDNRPGGGTIIGTDAVAKAAPDGLTLLVVAFPFGANPSLYRQLPYDTVTSFAPVVLSGRTPNIVVVNSKLPIRSVRELIAAAKAQPGKLNYGSTGVGSSNHLSMELFKNLAGVDITHVPYKGSAPMMTDLLGGHIDAAFDNLPNVLPHVRSGGVRALGTSTATRSTFAPDIPTVAESGVPGYDMDVWFGVVAPAGVPDEILDKLNAEINRVLRTSDVRARFTDQGVEPVGGSRSEFSDHIRTQIAKWAQVVKDANIKPE